MAALSVYGRDCSAGRLWLLRHIANQHHVRIVMAAHQSELFAVKRPMKIVDTLSLEIGDIAAFRSIYRL